MFGQKSHFNYYQGKIRNYWPNLGWIRPSKLVEFEIRDQIRPWIRISNSTLLAEFWIFVSWIRNSSELNLYIKGRDQYWSQL